MIPFIPSSKPCKIKLFYKSGKWCVYFVIIWSVYLQLVYSSICIVLFDLGFYPTYKLISGPFVSSWVRNEGLYHSQPKMGVSWISPDGMPAPRVGYITEEEPWVWESFCFIPGSEQACSLSQRETLPHFSKLLTTNTSPGNGSGKDQSGPFILSIPIKTNRNARDQWRVSLNIL